MTDPAPKVPPDDPTTFVFFDEISIIEHLARTAAERVLPEGLSLAGFSVLNHMVRLGHERRAPARIASAMQVTKGAMTGTLKRLEAGGWIVVAPDPSDGRAKVVSLTSAGRMMRDTAIASLQPEFDELLKRIDLAAIEAVLPTLQAIRRVLDAARD